MTNEIDKNSRAYKIAAGNGVFNLPNKLTILRVLLIPIFVALFYIQFKSHYILTVAVFAIASLTDFFDGKIARKYGLVTNLGKFLDPIADKVLVSSAFIILLTKPSFFTLALGDWAIVVAGCAVALILSREVIISGFRMVASDAGIVIAADKLGKYKTATQDFSIVVLLIGAGIAEFVGNNALVSVIFNYVGLSLFAVATVLTVISGINYIVKNINVLKV